MWCDSTPRAASWKPTLMVSSGHLEVVPATSCGRRGPPPAPARGCTARRAPSRPGGRCAPAGARSRSTTAGSSTRAPSRGMKPVFGQHHLQALAGRLQVAEVDQAGLRRDPLAGERAAAGVVGDERAVALVEHPRRRDPRVLVGEVARLRLGQRHLVPRVALVDVVAERVLRDERLLVGPVVEVRRAEQDPDREVDLDEVGRDQLALEDEARRDEPPPAPLGHVAVVVVDVVGVVEAAPADEVRVAVARPARSPAAPRRRSRRGRRAWARCACSSRCSASAARSSP